MTFYRLPREPLIAAWDKKTPSDFKFSFKVSRLITHHKRLKNAEPYFERFLEALEPVRKRGKLGCILFQFPPGFTIKEKDKLARFCKQLPYNFEHAVEFRHPSWLNKDTWSLLTSHDIAYAISDSSIRALGKVVITSDTHAFIRWHGRGKKSWYDYNYSKRQLQSWAKKFRTR
jgi:uncharacterized protein YecE (DUF72 family)